MHLLKIKEKTITIGLTIILGATTAFGNDSTDLVKHTPDFRFADGVYLDFEQLKKNAPVEKARILTTVGYDESNFFEEILSKKTFSFYDNFGKKFDYPVKSIWGYADNGILYKRMGENFYRVTIVGAICHFVAYVTTYDYNPSPYYGPYSNSHYYDYRTTSRNEKTDLKQYMIDFKTGKTLDFNISNLEVLLMADPELYQEFVELRKRKKKKMKFIFLRRFNERNPIHFPKKSILN